MWRGLHSDALVVLACILMALCCFCGHVMNSEVPRPVQEIDNMNRPSKSDFAFDLSY